MMGFIQIIFQIIYHVFTIPDLDYLYLIAMYYRWGLCSLCWSFFFFCSLLIWLLQVNLIYLYYKIVLKA